MTETVGSPKAIVLGTVLDGVPESIVHRADSAPRGESASRRSPRCSRRICRRRWPPRAGWTASGVRGGRIVATWVLIALVCEGAAMTGYGVLGAKFGFIVSIAIVELEQAI